ncbi:MAG: cupredoxin domain-containing protein [Bacillaceae bacterium]|nr:cupredoxin domain-containing protein [Bacillaceae bacterium]
MKSKSLFMLFSVVMIILATIPLARTIITVIGKEEDVIFLTMSGFEPDVLYLEAGVEKDVKLVNMETKALVGHDMLHQYASDELGFNYLLHAGEERWITLKVDEPGEYEVYCDTCCGGRENPYMRTKIVVR